MGESSFSYKGVIPSFVRKIFGREYERPGSDDVEATFPAVSGIEVEAAVPAHLIRFDPMPLAQPQAWIEISNEAAGMFKTVLRGDWDTAGRWFREDRERAKAVISSSSERPLHVAVGSGKSNGFVRELLDLMGDDDEAVALKDCSNETALHHAARVGNKEAVVMLVDRRPGMMYMTNTSDRLPVQIAAIHGHKEILTYLIEKSEAGPNVGNINSPFAGNLGVRLLMAVIASEYFDVALYLVDKYPDLARSRDFHDSDLHSDSYIKLPSARDKNIRSHSRVDMGPTSGLVILAGMSRSFPNGESCGFWHNFIYFSIIPLEYSSSWRYTTTISTTTGENDRKSSCSIVTKLSHKLRAVMSEAVQNLVPCVESIGRKKLKHQQALELVKSLCQKIESMPHDEASAMYEESIILAAKNGIHQVVREIAEISPTSIYAYVPLTGRNTFSIAAAERHENVFNLLYDMSDRKFNFYDSVDNLGNNLMHLCAYIAPSRKLDLVPGPALQMQRELQWF